MNDLKKTQNIVALFLLLSLSGCSMFRGAPARVDEPGSPSTQPQKQSDFPKSDVPKDAPEPLKVEPAKPSLEKRRITLVIGGAGVASFATVGLLKRFHEEGIEIESIVTTGWPTLFALAGGFLKSIHDVEWFAMRLQEKDFYKVGVFDPAQGYAGHEKLSHLIESNFKASDIGDSKYPLVISSANTEGDDSDVHDRGDWRTPLLKTMSVPGIFRPYPQGTQKASIQSLHGIEVTLARSRGAKRIVAVEMYGDYFNFLSTGKKDSSDGVFRQLYLATLRKSIAQELKGADLVGRIELQTSPTNFNQKRQALFLGYKEGARLAKAIRRLDNN